MSSAEGHSDFTHQEIPDRETANAAKWLSEQNVGFDTPTFWLVAGLLVAYNSELRRLGDSGMDVEHMKCPKCRESKFWIMCANPACDFEHDSRTIHEQTTVDVDTVSKDLGAELRKLHWVGNDLEQNTVAEIIAIGLRKHIAQPAALSIPRCPRAECDGPIEIEDDLAICSTCKNEYDAHELQRQWNFHKDAADRLQRELATSKQLLKRLGVSAPAPPEAEQEEP